MDRVKQSLTGRGCSSFRLPSGVGHDAAAMSGLMDVGMIITRRRKGISHTFEEAIIEGDAMASARLLLSVLEGFKN